MPKRPSFLTARRVAIAQIAVPTAKGLMFSETAVEICPKNPLTDYRRSLGFEITDAAKVTGLPANLFLAIEAATVDMSAREVLVLRGLYEQIAEHANSPSQKQRECDDRNVKSWDDDLSREIDGVVESGTPIALAYIDLLGRSLPDGDKC